jgi:hypothetical protein
MDRALMQVSNDGPERWITQIVGGVVTLIQRIDADAVVVRLQDLPDLCANVDLVSDEQATLIVGAIRYRLE